MTPPTLLIATERGIWRTPWGGSEQLPSLDGFSIDAPEQDIVAMAGRGSRAAALSDDGRCLIWDGNARAWLETHAWPDGQLECSRLILRESGAPLMGTVPVSTWECGEAGWTPVGDWEKAPGAGDWQALDAPYEPKVTALLEDPSRKLWAGISVGGLYGFEPNGWRPVDGGPRDVRDLAVWEGGLALAAGTGLFHFADGNFRSLSLPPQAAFAVRLSTRSDGHLGVAAAPGPPATWRGPDGARMSIWSFEPGSAVGRPVAGPIHGVVTDLQFDGDNLLVATDDGELWHVPLGGPSPSDPCLADLPAIGRIFLVDPPPAPD